ncbi:hypothetical protein Hdeb2414_s0021g00577201 [Helianthus debilis subsp. tardiflorus]
MLVEPPTSLHFYPFSFFASSSYAILQENRQPSPATLVSGYPFSDHATSARDTFKSVSYPATRAPHRTQLVFFILFSLCVCMCVCVM